MILICPLIRDSTNRGATNGTVTSFQMTELIVLTEAVVVSAITTRLLASSAITQTDWSKAL